MNSTLQCLYHIKEFTDYFLKNRKFIQKKNGLISTGLLDTFEGLSKSEEVSFYRPFKFKDNLIETDDSFKGKDGNDSGDLIITILSNCQEELGNDSDPHDMSLDQRQENLIFSDIFHKNLESYSIINDIFCFYVRVKNICFECGSIYYSIDLDNMIIFNLEQVFRMNAPDLTIKYDKRVVSVENCLSTFSFDKSSFCSKGMFC
jgi:ubiquitin C-terminal hydrolase